MIYILSSSPYFELLAQNANPEIFSIPNLQRFTFHVPLTVQEFQTNILNAFAVLLHKWQFSKFIFISNGNTQFFNVKNCVIPKFSCAILCRRYLQMNEHNRPNTKPTKWEHLQWSNIMMLQILRVSQMTMPWSICLTKRVT